MSDTVIAAIITGSCGIVVALIGAYAKAREAPKPAEDKPPVPFPAGAGPETTSPAGKEPGPPPPGAVPSADGRKRFWLRPSGMLFVTAGVLVAAAVLVAVLYVTGILGDSSGEDADPEIGRVRHSVKIRASKSSEPVGTRNGRKVYENSIWIEAPPDVMDRIAKVIYAFNDPTLFQEPRPQVSDRRSQFITTYIGVGPWARDMEVILVLRDGKHVTLDFNMAKAVYGK